MAQWLKKTKDKKKSLPASAEDAGDMGLIPGWERSPGRGNGNPLQYLCLGTPMDRGAWWATVHRVTESDTNKRLNTQAPRREAWLVRFPSA